MAWLQIDSTVIKVHKHAAGTPLNYFKYRDFFRLRSCPRLPCRWPPKSRASTATSSVKTSSASRANSDAMMSRNRRQ